MSELQAIKESLEARNNKARENPLWKEIKVAELVSEIKELLDCGCELASMKEPFKIRISCKCCGHLFYSEEDADVEDLVLARDGE